MQHCLKFLKKIPMIFEYIFFAFYSILLLQLKKQLSEARYARPGQLPNHSKIRGGKEHEQKQVEQQLLKLFQQCSKQ